MGVPEGCSSREDTRVVVVKNTFIDVRGMERSESSRRRCKSEPAPNVRGFRQLGVSIRSAIPGRTVRNRRKPRQTQEVVNDEDSSLGTAERYQRANMVVEAAKFLRKHGEEAKFPVLKRVMTKLFGKTVSDECTISSGVNWWDRRDRPRALRQACEDASSRGRLRVVSELEPVHFQVFLTEDEEANISSRVNMGKDVSGTPEMVMNLIKDLGERATTRWEVEWQLYKRHGGFLCQWRELLQRMDRDKKLGYRNHGSKSWLVPYDLSEQKKSEDRAGPAIDLKVNKEAAKELQRRVRYLLAGKESMGLSDLKRSYLEKFKEPLNHNQYGADKLKQLFVFDCMRCICNVVEHGSTVTLVPVTPAQH